MKKIKEVEKTYEVKGTNVTFMEKILINENTGEEIFDSKLEQENDVNLFNKYREMNGLLLPQQIREIRVKLGVTQTEFAKILGVGEKTITRYENGSLQDMAQNNLIKSVAKEPLYFLELLRSCRKLKDEMSEESYKKLVIKVKSAIEIITHFRLDISKEDYKIKEYPIYLPEEIAEFVLKEYNYEKTKEMLSPLKLQKLLNYIYSYCLAVWDYKIFDESPQAWAHGPVFKSVYDKYSSYKYKDIDIPKEKTTLHEKNFEKLVLKIAEGYGIYNARELEKLTHREEPWKKARERAKAVEGESCKEIIRDSDIKEYFKRLLNC